MTTCPLLPDGLLKGWSEKKFPILNQTLLRKQTKKQLLPDLNLSSCLQLASLSHITNHHYFFIHFTLFDENITKSSFVWDSMFEDIFGVEFGFLPPLKL